MIGDVGAGVQRDGHAGGGALVQGAVGQRAQEEPGQLTDVGDALDELLRSAGTNAVSYTPPPRYRLGPETLIRSSFQTNDDLMTDPQTSDTIRTPDR